MKRFLTGAALVTCAAAAGLAAQQQPVFRAGQDVVRVFATVTDRDGRLVTADLTEIVDRARRAAPGLFARRTAWLAEHDLSDSPFG